MNMKSPVFKLIGIVHNELRFCGAMVSPTDKDTTWCVSSIFCFENRQTGGHTYGGIFDEYS